MGGAALTGAPLLMGSFSNRNRNRKAPVTSLLGQAVRESLSIAQANRGRATVKCWAGRFLQMVESFAQGRDPSGAIGEFLATGGLKPDGQLTPLPWVRVWASWDAMLREPWDQVVGYPNPRQGFPESNLIKLATYDAWFATDAIPQHELDAGYPQYMPRYIRHTGGIPSAYVNQLMRLRTGAHHLAIETGRWTRPRLPRHHRICTKCTRTVVEDEVHLLFECPAYDHIRARYTEVLFSKFGGVHQASRLMKEDPSQVRAFMDQEPVFQVAKFVYECMEHRRSEECVDWVPYFDLDVLGAAWRGQVFDTLSSGPRVVQSEYLTSSAEYLSLSAHGA